MDPRNVGSLAAPVVANDDYFCGVTTTIREGSPMPTSRPQYSQNASTAGGEESAVKTDREVRELMTQLSEGKTLGAAVGENRGLDRQHHRTPESVSAPTTTAVSSKAPSSLSPWPRAPAPRRAVSSSLSTTGGPLKSTTPSLAASSSRSVSESRSGRTTYLMMGVGFVMFTTAAHSKTIRDDAEANKLPSKVHEPRTNKFLAAHGLEP